MDWHRHWNSYPKKFGKTEFLQQVQNTVGGKPVPEAAIRESIETLCARLALARSDRVLDLCCGNGLISRQIASRCREVVGVDFSETLIDIADTFHGGENITYLKHDVRTLRPLFEGRRKFDKIMMLAGLQYLSEEEFPALLGEITSVLAENGTVLFCGVPDAAYRSQFYHTPSRRLRHLWRRMTGRDQMGTWWHKAVIERTCREQELDCFFFPSDSRSNTASGASYRFDVKIIRHVSASRD